MIAIKYCSGCHDFIAKIRKISMRKVDIFYWIIILTLSLSCFSLWNSCQSLMRSFHIVKSAYEQLREGYPKSGWVDEKDIRTTIEEQS